MEPLFYIFFENVVIFHLKIYFILTRENVIFHWINKYVFVYFVLISSLENTDRCNPH
jgi:hypothetical protein